VIRGNVVLNRFHIIQIAKVEEAQDP
jgi:hypothetical protein